jgi:small subunit ribosomal protein S6
VKQVVSEKELNVEDEQLRDYELVFIISPEVAEDRCDTIIENISRFITEKGGVVSEVERWGRRKLAYPIKSFVEGSYVLSRFKLKPTLSKDLEANLRISEDIVRHLLVKLSG